MNGTKLYTVELTDAQYEDVRASMAGEAGSTEKLAAELDSGSEGSQALGRMMANRAEGFRAVERMCGEEDVLTFATSRLRAWYYGRVRDLAEDVLDSMLRGDVSDLEDYLHETVDGTDIVVYTFKAKCALLASDNEDAHEEEFGSGEPATSEARAYMALRADVREALESMVNYGAPEGVTLPEGFDLNDPETWTPETEDDADDDLEGRLESAGVTQ